MSQRIFIFVVGLLIGAAVTLVGSGLFGGKTAGPEDPELTRLRAGISDLEQQRDALQARLEEERVAHREQLLAAVDAAAPHGEESAPRGPGIEDEPIAVPEPEPAAGGPPDEEQIVAAMRKFGAALSTVIMGQEQGAAAVAELRAFFANVTESQLAEILVRYGDEPDMNKKIVMAHALAQSGRPEALLALREIVLDRNKAFTDRRFVAHGLAFVDDPALQPLLREITRNDEDRGVRANAAFGLARVGAPDGIALYTAATDEAFAEKDPAAMQYLSGFMLLGKSAMPQVRERIETYREPQSRILLIQLVKKELDRDSLPALRRVSEDGSVEQAVRESARQAIDVIEAADQGE